MRSPEEVLELTAELERKQPTWEMKREHRRTLESELDGFTGLVHIVELHIPYTHWTDVEEMMEKAKNYKGKKILVSAGDSINLDMFSFFYNTSTDVRS